ncbi:MAG: RNA methyltransferase [Cyclobacteriaceae bacterium]|nr:RNA methyltransferase [Cyclobacteriaceae bacterium]UYN85647.1 MAG: RNA methyltransferase [Cyclobacteriaceae bacterium]
MLSKARIKYIKSLQVKKYRQLEQRFVVEGAKSVLELLGSDFVLDTIIGTPSFISSNQSLLDRYKGELVEVKASLLSDLGEFKTNDTALAIARIKPNLALRVGTDEFVLMLDDIRDPGNLGTIIRVADWYGITKVIASTDTTDLYNSKVLHASMGSFTRVGMYYTNLVHFLDQVTVPVWGTFLGGENVHTMAIGKSAIIVIGNEARGISEAVEKKVTQRVTIPRFGGAESLNAAVATAIICDNLRRPR